MLQRMSALAARAAPHRTKINAVGTSRLAARATLHRHRPAATPAAPLVLLSLLSLITKLVKTVGLINTVGLLKTVEPVSTVEGVKQSRVLTALLRLAAYSIICRRNLKFESRWSEVATQA